jgi:hypothetical protein
MRALELVGIILGFILMGAFGIAMLLLEAWAFFRFGVIAWVVATPFVMSVVGLVLVIAASVVGAMGGGFAWLVHTLVGGVKGSQES